MILFTDVETTSLLYVDIPRYDPEQPHIVQWAMLLTDNDFNDKGCFSSLIKPAGWTIPPSATHVHGITTEMCEFYGLDISVAVSMFSWWCYMADEIIFYNKGYDDEVILCEYTRLGKEHYMLEDKRKCAMRPCTKLLELPNPRGFPGYKFAKLTEAYEFFFKQKLEGAHDALVDVRATRDVYRKLRELNEV